MSQDCYKASFRDIQIHSAERVVHLVPILFLIMADIIKNQIDRFNNSHNSSKGTFRLSGSFVPLRTLFPRWFASPYSSKF